MGNDLVNKINDVDIEYVIIQKTMNDILNEVTNNEDDRFIYEAIISNLEKDAANGIKDNKVVSLPNIGCIRKSPYRNIIKGKSDIFRIARKNMSKDDYREHVRDIYKDAKIEEEKKDRIKLTLTRIRRNNKKKYEYYFLNLGRAYAEMFILSIYWLKEIPYDDEVQQHLDSLKD